MGTISSKNNIPGTKYIAFFDLDRTIIIANSSKLIVMHAYKKGFIGKMDIIKGIYLSLMYRFDLMDTQKIIDNMVKWVTGISEVTMNDLFNGIFIDNLLQSIRQEVNSELIFHKKRNAKTVILSSALLPVCKAVADYLKIDDIICSDLEIINGIYTGRPRGKLCFGEEKVNRLMDYCDKSNNTAREAWYYADSFSDLPALSSVGYPVCINPEKRLKREARERGWDVRRWH